MTAPDRAALEAEFDAVASALRLAVIHAECEVQRLRTLADDLPCGPDDNTFVSQLEWAEMDLTEMRATVDFLGVWT